MFRVLFVYFTLDRVYKFLGSFIPNPNQDKFSGKKQMLFFVNEKVVANARTHVCTGKTLNIQHSFIALCSRMTH